jgi:hypothetical protein
MQGPKHVDQPPLLLHARQHGLLLLLLLAAGRCSCCCCCCTGVACDQRNVLCAVDKRLEADSVEDTVTGIQLCLCHLL